MRQYEIPKNSQFQGVNLHTRHCERKLKLAIFDCLSEEVDDESEMFELIK